MIIIIWFLTVFSTFIILIHKAKLHLEYYKILNPEKYGKYSSWLEYLYSFNFGLFSSVLVMLPIILRKKEYELKDKVLNDKGRKATTWSIIYFILLIVDIALIPIMKKLYM